MMSTNGTSPASLLKHRIQQDYNIPHCETFNKRAQVAQCDWWGIEITSVNGLQERSHTVGHPIAILLPTVLTQLNPKAISVWIIPA